MNTYFQQSLTEVQSEQFIADFKATVRFIFRLIKLLFLLLTAIFSLGKLFYCKLSRQKVINQESGLSFKEETLPTSLESDRTVNDSISDSTTEDNLQQEQSEGTLVVSTDKVDNTVDRQKELKQMKATKLRKLCTDYSINYQNKQQAVTAILEFESPNVAIPF